MKYTFKIAGVVFSIHVSWPVTMEDRFIPFVSEEEKDGYEIIFEESNKLPIVDGEVLFENNGFAIYKLKDNALLKCFHNNSKEKKIYAYCDALPKGKQIKISCIDKSYMRNINSLFFHIGVEDILLKEKRIYFHSCCVDSPYGGILFSGVSGSGKSTQGRLWEEYRNAKIINGDKTILYKDENWIGCGSPYAGSSNIYLNEKCIIKAIVMLKKAPVCSIRKLRKAEAFSKVYSQIIIDVWNDDFIHKACDIATDLICDVDVYEFSCTPDQEAVNYLINMIKGGA